MMGIDPSTVGLSHLRALLTGLLLGTGIGALAGWPIGLGIGGALTALLLMQSFIPRLVARADTSSKSGPLPISADRVEIYHVSDPLLIDRASSLLSTLRAIGRGPRVLILDLTELDRIDATGLRIIDQTLDRENGSGMLVLVAGCDRSTAETLSRSRPLHESLVFRSLDDAVRRARIHVMTDKGS